MKINGKIFAAVGIFLVSIFLLSLPVATLANPLRGDAPASSQLVPCGGPSDPCTLCHFIVGFHNLIQYGLFWVITFALVGIFISGVMYVVSTGNEGMITKAKGFMKACLIGFAVVAGAWIIVNTTLRALSAKGDLGVGATNWFTFNCDTATNQGVTSPCGSSGTCSEDGTWYSD